MSKKLNKVVTDELCRRGNFDFVLRPSQKDIKKKIQDSTQKVNVVMCSRRIGKSFLLIAMAFEHCIKKPGAIVNFLAPTKIMINSILRPLVKELEDKAGLPEDLIPAYNKNLYVYTFPNGSEIRLAGTDGGHADKLRGGSADLCIVDEAGFCDGLTNIIQSVLIPTTLTTRGKIVISSTPPYSFDHDFLKFAESAEEKGAFIKKTIYDNESLTQEDIDITIAGYPTGTKDAQFRREYLCEIIKDEQRSVIPEFDDVLEAELVKEWERPSHFDWYVGMDLGFTDLTVALYGYYDFKAAKLIIEDEVVMNGASMTLPVLAGTLIKKEQDLYTSPHGELIPPYVRVSDINYIVTNELSATYGLNFQNARKDDNDAALNSLRVMLINKQIIINPKCKHLIRHLKNARWTANRQKFERSPDSGHYDAIDALKYLIRAVNYTKNPYPPGYHLQGEVYKRLITTNYNQSHTAQVLGQVFYKAKRKFR